MNGEYTDFGTGLRETNIGHSLNISWDILIDLIITRHFLFMNIPWFQPMQRSEKCVFLQYHYLWTSIAMPFLI
jgi:hypothetical protein